MQLLHPNAVWYFFLSRALGTLIFSFFIFFVLLVRFISNSYSSLTFAPMLILYALVLVGVYFWAVWFYGTYRYELREDAFRKEHGVIWKKYVSIPYNRIQNVDINRGLLSRILGLSDLHIQTAGNSGVRSSEGTLPGLAPQTAEQIRDELIRRSRTNNTQPII